MHPRKRKLFLIGLFAVSTIGVAAVLFYRYADVLRAYVVRPAIETYFIVRFYIETLPQLLWWLIPPIVVSLMLLRRFLRPPRSTASASRPAASRTAHLGEGDLTHLYRLLGRASHSRFARVRVSRTLAEIAARLIARREGTTLHEARRRMAAGYWRDIGTVHRFLTPRKHYTTRQDHATFDDALRETLDQLETYDRAA